MRIEEFFNGYKPQLLPRFSFQVRDNVQDELRFCYKKAIEFKGEQFSEKKELAVNIAKVADWLKNGKNGLILSGRVGTGKSMMLKALDLLFKFYLNGKNGLKIYQATDINDLALSKLESDNDTFKSLSKIKYLGIDELGGYESNSINKFGTVKIPIAELLHNRECSEGKITIITTNLDNNDIKSRFGDRIEDRLMGSFNEIIFDYDSFRRKYP